MTAWRSYSSNAVPAAILMFAAVAGANAASPLFDGTSSNAWLLEKSSGQVVGTFTVATGDTWTEQAIATGPMSVRIFFDGSSFIDYTNLDLIAQEVLVNQTDQSLPTLNPGLPAVTLAGVDLALSDSNPNVPGIAIAPAPGTYDGTVAVRLRAVPGRDNLDPLRILWRVNGGTEENVLSPTGGEKLEHTFYLVADGSYQVDFWAGQGGFKSQPAPQTANYTIAASEPLQRDTDADGIPDLVEVALGLNPLVDDYALDTDGDGWSDFEERMRGTDPDNPLDLPAFSLTDTDGDGCPDFLEKQLGFSTIDPASRPGVCLPVAAGVTTTDTDFDGYSEFDERMRGTDPGVASDHPVSRRPHEVEYQVTGSIYQDAAQTLEQTFMGKLTARDINWELLYDQQSLGAADTVAAALAMAAGNLPPGLRLPAGDPVLLRAAHEPGGVPDKWVAKGWLDNSPDLHPRDVTDWLAANSITWTTVAEWQSGYESYLMDPLNGLVRARTAHMSPASGLGTALVEGVVAWYATLTDGAMVLLGHDSGQMPEDAVTALRERLSTAGREFNGLHAELTELTLPGKELNGFATTVAGFYANPLGIMESTTTRAAAALVQGTDRDALYSYLVRLLGLVPLAEIDALTALQRAALLVPMGDADSDGVVNGDELNRPVEGATLPTDADSDDDLFPDDLDPCPADAENLCLLLRHQDDDSDGDGFNDAVDNCMNVANITQKDTNSDGIGDHCRYYANIQSPASDVTVWLGGKVNFTSLVTEKGAGRALAYNWSFGGGAPNSTLADPGNVHFMLNGSFPVTLEVADKITGNSVGVDQRTVHVAGIGPTVDAGGPYVGIEGQSTQLIAIAAPAVGGISGYGWSFGDGNLGIGNPVSHTYLQDGSYTATVEVSDATGVPASDTAIVNVADTGPVVGFTVSATQGVAPLVVQFTDASSAYDGISARLWDFDDSVTSTSINPLHTYTNRGVYDVTLTATDGDGSVDSAGSQLRISSGFNLLNDTDSDGMPDGWEVGNGTNPGMNDAAVDFEPDGYTSLDEFLADTDPQHVADSPEGVAPLSYILYRDHFDDATFADRWSVGLESPLAVHSELESGSEVQMNLQLPSGETCSTTSLVSFGTVDGTSFVAHARTTLLGSGEFCMRLVPGEDLSNRIDMCATADGAGYDVILRAYDAGAMSMVPGTAQLPQGVPVNWRLIKMGDDYHLYTWEQGAMAVQLQAQLTSTGPGNAGIRPLLTLSNCAADLGGAMVDVDLVEILRDSDDDGLADLAEDTNLNGIVDPGESNPGSPDSDGDGTPDGLDNCSLVSNVSLRDTDADGVGNACDADLNNDGVVDSADVVLFRARVFTTDADADLNGDGVVDSADVVLLRDMVFQPPGPSGLAP